MDAYRSATAKLDAEFAALTNKMQGVAAEVSFAQLRNHPVAVHVGELLLAAARVERPSRDDAALAKGVPEAAECHWASIRYQVVSHQRVVRVDGVGCGIP